MHEAIFKNRQAFDVLVDAVHVLMDIEDWDNAKELNHLRLVAINIPNKEIDTYKEAVHKMKNIPVLKQHADKLYNLIREV